MAGGQGPEGQPDTAEERLSGDSAVPSPSAGDAGKVVKVKTDESGFELADSGSSVQAGAPVVRAFPFAFDSPNILTGHAVYTPTVGDILLDAWIEIDTAWNGTTPLGDFGEFVGTAQGLFAGGNGPTGLTTMSGPDTNLVGVGYLAGNNGESLAALSAAGSAGFRVAPGKFTTVDPIKVVVSQDGTNTGADPGSTQGSAVLYLVTATPAIA